MSRQGFSSVMTLAGKILPYHIKRLVTAQYMRIRFGVEIGRGTNISLDTVFEGMNRVMDNCMLNGCVIGKGTYIAPNSSLYNTRVGRFCSIGPRTHIVIGRHPSERFVSTHPAFFSLRKQAGFTFTNTQLFTEHPVVEGRFSVDIGSDVWIGSNVIIMDGVKVADGSIIGAGSIVTKSIPAYSISVGVPARVLRFRFREDIIDRLLKFQWWNKDIKWIRANYLLFTDVEKFLNSVDGS